MNEQFGRLSLQRQGHQDFILACHHYARAFKEVGFDAGMVFIRLVSAIETLSTNMPLDGKDDKLEKQGVTDLIEQSPRCAFSWKVKCL